jgi:hypothetical protein
MVRFICIYGTGFKHMLVVLGVGVGLGGWAGGGGGGGGGTFKKADSMRLSSFAPGRRESASASRDLSSKSMSALGLPPKS